MGMRQQQKNCYKNKKNISNITLLLSNLKNVALGCNSGLYCEPYSKTHITSTTEFFMCKAMSPIFNYFEKYIQNTLLSKREKINKLKMKILSESFNEIIIEYDLAVKVGALYALFMLYFTQPYARHQVRIYAPLV